AVDTLRHALVSFVHLQGTDQRRHGRSTLGHPHGAALRDLDGRGGQEPEHRRHPRGWDDLLVGHGP
ncbi:unnamed protein product, partial [Symbiodinium sp. KB8]